MNKQRKKNKTNNKQNRKKPVYKGMFHISEINLTHVKKKLNNRHFFILTGLTRFTGFLKAS